MQTDVQVCPHCDLVWWVKNQSLDQLAERQLKSLV